MDRAEFIYGRNPVVEMLDRGEPFEQILLQKGTDREFIQEVTTKARDLNIPVQLVPKEKLMRITRKNHQGVIGYTSWVTYRDMQYVVEQCFEKGKTPLLMLLDRVTDVRNVGAIARSAEVFGVDALVLPEKGSARLGGDAVKTSAGAITRIAICRERSIASACRTLASMGLEVLVADQAADRHIHEYDLKTPLAIVLGSEGEGVSDAVRKAGGAMFSIPQKGMTESLNVSVVAGISLYEVTRQRTT